MLCRERCRSVCERANSKAFIPLVLGIVLIVPIQGYMARLQQGTLNGGYIKYLFTQFFQDFSDISGIAVPLLRDTYGSYYIFLFFLRAFADVYIYNKYKEYERPRFYRSVFNKEWFLFLIFIPLTISEALPDIGGKNPFSTVCISL